MNDDDLERSRYSALVKRAFAKKLRELSGRRNLSQEKLAGKMRVSQSQISNYMDDRKGDVKLSMALKLAEFFAVPLEMLSDPGASLASEEDLELMRDVTRLVARLGPQRAYDRLAKIDDGGVSPVLERSAEPPVRRPPVPGHRAEASALPAETPRTLPAKGGKSRRSSNR